MQVLLRNASSRSVARNAPTMSCWKQASRGRHLLMHSPHIDEQCSPRPAVTRPAVELRFTVLRARDMLQHSKPWSCFFTLSHSCSISIGTARAISERTLVPSSVLWFATTGIFEGKTPLVPDSFASVASIWQIKICRGSWLILCVAQPKRYLPILFSWFSQQLPAVCKRMSQSHGPNRPQWRRPCRQPVRFCIYGLNGALSSTCSPLSPSITHSLFHSRLKTHLFTNLFHHSLIAPTRTAFSDYTGPNLPCSTVFHF